MPDALQDAYRSGRVAAITGDALAYYADTATIIAAAEALERGDFTSWQPDEQREAAAELRALAECYEAQPDADSWARANGQ